MRPFSSRHTSAERRSPVTASQISGVRPVTRNDASNVESISLSCATKYQSVCDGALGERPSVGADHRAARIPPGARTGRRCATTLAPASTNSPILFSIFSLIVSVFGSTSNSYSTPPGTTTLPFFTFSNSTARVAQRSYLTPFALGRLIRVCEPLGASSPHQHRTSATKRPSWSIHWQRLW